MDRVEINILNNILGIEHGFRHIDDGADKIMSKYSVFKTDTERAVLNTFAHAAVQKTIAAAKKNLFLRFIGII